MCFDKFQKIFRETPIIKSFLDSYQGRYSMFIFQSFALHCTKNEETADLVTFTEETMNGKLYFCAVLRNF